MPEVNAKKEQLQIYKEKLSELYRQKEDLLSQNQALQAENNDLQSQNRDLFAQCETLMAENRTLDSNLPALTDQISEDPLALPPPKIAKRRLLFLLTALLALAAIITAVGFYVRMERFEESYYQEEDHSQQLEEALSKTQNALEETQNALTEREKMLTQLRNGLAEGFGYSSSKLYADEDVVILDVGQQKTVEVYNPRYYMFAAASDEESIRITQDDAYAVRPNVYITARQPGMCKVTCAAYSTSTPTPESFKESFDILVIVRES